MTGTGGFGGRGGGPRGTGQALSSLCQFLRPDHLCPLVPCSLCEGQASQQVGTRKVLEGHYGIPEPQDQAHQEVRSAQLPMRVGIKKGAEEGTYLFFVYSKEGLHWSVGTASKQKHTQKRSDAFPPAQAGVVTASPQDPLHPVCSPTPYHCSASLRTFNGSPALQGKIRMFY